MKLLNKFKIILEVRDKAWYNKDKDDKSEKNILQEVNSYGLQN